jgi:hypothetical protein
MEGTLPREGLPGTLIGRLMDARIPQTVDFLRCLALIVTVRREVLDGTE